MSAHLEGSVLRPTRSACFRCWDYLSRIPRRLVVQHNREAHPDEAPDLSLKPRQERARRMGSSWYVLACRTYPVYRGLENRENTLGLEAILVKTWIFSTLGG